ncbi:SCP2 sterol-binding domain-containing protein [Thermodesulfobacteriota bacterium]
MSQYFGTTVEEIFNSQTDRFRPEGAKGVDAVFAYDISGEGGGQWKVIVREMSAKTEKVEGGEYGEYSVKLITDAETFVGITIGKIDGMEAFSGGKVRVDGDMSLMTVLPQLFTKFATARKAVTAREIITTAEERFTPGNAEGLDVTVGYDFAGDGGGKWTAVIKDGTCVLEEGLREDCTVTNIASAQDYVDLMLGKLDPMIAIGAGRLRLVGDMDLAMKLPKIFAKFEADEVEKGPELIALKRTISVNMQFSTGPVMGRFFEGLMEKKILANQCPQCGRKQLPPREVCAVCRCRVEDFVEVGPDGMLARIEDVYYASPDPLTGETRETPYGVIYVLLDGCSGLETFWHMLKAEDLADAEHGARVRPIWNDTRVGSVDDIQYFELIR